MLLRGACSRLCACFLLSLLSASSIANGAAAITSTATATAISYCPFSSPFFILSSSTSSTMTHHYDSSLWLILCTYRPIHPLLVHVLNYEDNPTCGSRSRTHTIATRRSGTLQKESLTTSASWPETRKAAHFTLGTLQINIYVQQSACEAIRGIFAAFLIADLQFHWLTHSITIQPPSPQKNKKIGKRQSNPSRTLTKRRANTTCSNSPLHAGTLQNRWPTVCRRR